MTLRYTRVARITAHVEEALRKIDWILSEGFNWKELQWESRDLRVTNIHDHNHTNCGSDSYVDHTKLVKLDGQTLSGHKVECTVMFKGDTHLVESRIGQEMNDYSEPLSVDLMKFKIVTKDGTRLKKTCFLENMGSTFFFR